MDINSMTSTRFNNVMQKDTLARNNGKIYLIFITQGDLKKIGTLLKIYYSGTKYRINIWYAPNCRATLKFFQILAVESCTHFRHQGGTSVCHGDTTVINFLKCSILFESPCIRLHKTSLRAELG
jgi:hypothetical protein